MGLRIAVADPEGGRQPAFVPPAWGLAQNGERILHLGFGALRHPRTQVRRLHRARAAPAHEDEAHLREALAQVNDLAVKGGVAQKSVPAHDADDLTLMVGREKILDGGADRMVVEITRKRFPDVAADGARFEVVLMHLEVERVRDRGFVPRIEARVEGIRRIEVAAIDVERSVQPREDQIGLVERMGDPVGQRAAEKEAVRVRALARQVLEVREVDVLKDVAVDRPGFGD